MKLYYLQCKQLQFAVFGKVILGVFLWGRALSKYFLGKDGSVPLEKMGPYAYKCNDY